MNKNSNQKSNHRSKNTEYIPLSALSVCVILLITLIQQSYCQITLSDLTKDAPNRKYFTYPPNHDSTKDKNGGGQSILQKGGILGSRNRRMNQEATTPTAYKVAMDVTNLGEVRTRVTDGNKNAQKAAKLFLKLNFPHFSSFKNISL